MVDPLAQDILEKLSRKPEAGEIVLGGYFALQQYADYRQTHDIDAWWKGRASPASELAIREVMQSVAEFKGFQFQERRFGETISFELLDAGRKGFSFQIAVRSIGLEEPLPSKWPPILIETLADNIGSKMNALVDRGSPRDFTDIYRVVTAELMDVETCWELWGRKNPGGAVEAARQKVLLHLAALEARRPLDQIVDNTARVDAAATREWFKRQFLRV